MQMADGFYNNQFVGTWTSYKTNSSKKCHWGDFRIPESGDLDSGDGEFIVNEKYAKNGWSNYITAHSYGYPISNETQKAQEIEKEKWWNPTPNSGSFKYLISNKSVGEFKIGQQMIPPYPSDIYKIEKGIRKERIEGESVEIDEYRVFENGNLVLIMETSYDFDANKYSDIIDEIVVVSEKFKTKEGIGVNSTIDDFIKSYPKYKLWWAYIRDIYVINSESIGNIQFLLDADDFIPEPKIDSEITYLKYADFKKGSKIKRIRVL